MYTTLVNDENGKAYFILHNGDWSGEATIRPVDSRFVFDRWEGEVKVPGFVIKNASKMAHTREIMSRVTSAVERTLVEYEKEDT